MVEKLENIAKPRKTEQKKFLREREREHMGGEVQREKENS